MSKNKPTKATIASNMRSIRELEQNMPEIPYPVWVALWGSKPGIFVANGQLSLGQDSDYVDIEQFQSALTWLVEQLDGKVTWSSNGKND